MHKRRKRKLNQKSSYQGRIVSFEITPALFNFVLDRKSNDEIVPLHRRKFVRGTLNFDLSPEATKALFLRFFGGNTETVEDVVEGEKVYAHRFYRDILDAEILDE